MSIKTSEVANRNRWGDDVRTIPRREGGIHPAFVPDGAAPSRDERPIGPTFVPRNDFGSSSSEAFRFTARDDPSSSSVAVHAPKVHLGRSELWLG